MDKYLKKNKKHWDEVTPVHEKSGYDVKGFKAGGCTLKPIEVEEMGNVKGKSLLHLQCHFGLDTLSWARRGAKATGVDFSDKAIELAQKLSQETGVKANFICSDIYELPKILNKKFDIVFTSYGVLCWLKDLNKWAEIINRFLKPGGYFYIAEQHPFANIFNNEPGAKKLEVTVPYFHNPEPLEWAPGNDYADPTFASTCGTYEWMHPIGEIVDALIGAGLKIEFLHEFPFVCYKAMPFMIQDKDGNWRLKGDPLPLTFSIKATK
ncbi:MAG: class I SAM-dependent methyltransferase [Dehalococcoidales bacterium]|nr:class I SAM-dependent methyltransferase [Dehalococcoidales bacterium]